ncbi:MAG: type II secretory pathway, component PulD [Opitutae bacterium]|nr:type II secretory pathway, component PulD [Opitutae bacterium]
MHRPAKFLVLMLVLTGLAARAPAATDAAAVKIRLLSEALHARDAGDTATARRNLQELLTLTPADETVKRLLASLDRPARKQVSVAGGTVAPAADALSEADQLARAEEDRLARLIEAAGAAAKQARALARQDRFPEAFAVLDRAQAGLPGNGLTKEAAAGLDAARAEIASARDRHLAAVAAKAAEAASRPAEDAAVAPASRASDEVSALAARGRSQYLAGDPGAAAQTFRRVAALEPDNAAAAYFLQRIASESPANDAARARTSAQMISEVDRAWQPPGAFTGKPPEPAGAAGTSMLLEKLNHIVLPSVNFSGMELSRVVNTLSIVSEEFDRTETAPKGVNIVLLDQGNANPVVNLTLRNLPLKRVLDFITGSVGYQYEVQADAIVVRPGGEPAALETQFFPVSRSTVLRLTGRGAAANPAGTDPLAGGTTAAPATSVEGEGRSIRNFLQLAGVSFDGVPGSSLAFDGSQLIATQTPRNLERIRNILSRYNGVRQVEIEAKFMEVQQGALEELGVHWNLGKKGAQHSGATKSDYRTSNRSINEAFSFQGGTQSLQITAPGGTTTVDGNPVTSPGTELTLPVNAPTIPGTVSLGSGASALAAITGIIGEFDVSAIVRALSQKSGTELLSAPKLTVLSGNPATITVAQELRYPQSYGQIQSQVGTGSNSGGGSAGVSITSGTPQEFTTRNVGVELKVTPTVEEDDYSVSLDLNPKVTEFEGFVEYGGPSVAISGGTTVTVPPGFYQPIFAVREVTTKVTIWDGATLVMGGLTREDVKKVRDKVPVLGNLPGIGRLFRSDGESSQKRNLLIFVTANLVSPDGSLRKQAMSGAPSGGTIFENPTIATPADPVPRGG